jgi:hypothetical protein
VMSILSPFFPFPFPDAANDDNYSEAMACRLISILTDRVNNPCVCAYCRTGVWLLFAIPAVKRSPRKSCGEVTRGPIVVTPPISMHVITSGIRWRLHGARGDARTMGRDGARNGVM